LGRRIFFFFWAVRGGAGRRERKGEGCGPFAPPFSGVLEGGETWLVHFFAGPKNGAGAGKTAWAGGKKKGDGGAPGRGFRGGGGPGD